MNKLTSLPPVTSPATQSVFRQEAVEHSSIRNYGSIVLVKPLSFRYLTYFFLIIVLGIIAFLSFFSTVRKAQCQGVLLPGLGVIKIVPPQTGTIKERRVKEGTHVRIGDILFVLSSERSGASGDTQKTISSLLIGRRDSFTSEVKQLETQTRLRNESLTKRINDISSDINRLDNQIALQKQRVDLSEKAWKRYSDLQTSNFISAAQLQDKEADFLDQQQRLNDLFRTKAVSQRDLDSAGSELRDLKVQTTRDAASLKRNASSIEQDLTDSEARREIFVRSPKDGVITAITTEVGQTVTSSQAVASVLPSPVSLEAEIYAPSRSIGFIKPGMTVLLRYQAYPYQKFGQYAATISEVANTSLRPDEMVLPGATLPAGSASEPLYRIRLKLDKQTVKAYGKDMPLKSGMIVDASVLLDKRRLYEWILEPLYSITGRL